MLGARRAEWAGDVRDAIAGIRDAVDWTVWGQPRREDRHADEEHEDREPDHRRPAVPDPDPHNLHSTEGHAEGSLERGDHPRSDHDFGCAHGFSSRNLDSRIEQEEDEIGDEVREHDRDAAYDDDELEKRKVEVIDRLDRLPSNSVVIEDNFDLVGTPDNEGEVQGDQADHRRQADWEHVPTEDLAVAQPFRLRGRDEILRHDVDEGAPHDEGDSRERAEGQREGRQDEVLSGARQMGPVPGPLSEHVVVVPLRRQGGPPREIVAYDGAFLKRRKEEEPEPEDGHAVEEDSRRG